MEGALVQAITHRADCAIAIAEGNAGGRGEARGIVESVAAFRPELELMAHEQVTSTHGILAWFGPRDAVEALEREFRAVRGPGGEWSLAVEHDAAYVSLIGLGLGADVVARAEMALEKAGIAIRAVRTSPAAVTVRVDDTRLDDAVRTLHGALIG